MKHSSRTELPYAKVAAWIRHKSINYPLGYWFFYGSYITYVQESREKKKNNLLLKCDNVKIIHFRLTFGLNGKGWKVLSCSYPINAPWCKHYSGESKKAVALQEHAANTSLTAW